MEHVAKGNKHKLKPSVKLRRLQHTSAFAFYSRTRSLKIIEYWFELDEPEMRGSLFCGSNSREHSLLPEQERAATGQSTVGPQGPGISCSSEVVKKGW